MKKKNSLYLMWRLLSLCFEKEGKISIGIFGLAFIRSLIPAGSLVVLQHLINSISKSRIEDSLFFIVLYSFLLLTSNLLSAGFSYLQKLFGVKIAKDIDFAILEKAMSLTLSEFEDSDIYDALKRAIAETQRPSENFALIIGIFENIIIFITYVVIILSWNIWLMPILLVLPILSFFVTYSMGKYEFQIKQERTEEQRKLSYLNAVLNNDIAYKENHILGITYYLREMYEKKYNEFLTKDKAIIRKQSLSGIIFRITETLIGCLILITIIRDGLRTGIMGGNIVSFISAIWGSIGAADSIASGIASLFKNCLYIENLVQFLDKESCKTVHGKEKKVIIGDIRLIEFKNVSFRYKKSLPYVLENVSFIIDASNRVAIVGKNGSGKSTIIKLLCGYYDSYEGEITINGISLQNIDLKSYRKQVDAVFQDYSRYAFTVNENFMLGDIEAPNHLTVHQKLKAVSECGLLEFIKKLPQQWDTQLSNNFKYGVQISGGQWQQLAIIRSMLKEATMFILDEPSSSLDLETERRVFQYLQQRTEGKVCILVTHRLHSIVGFINRAIVMKNGSLVEDECIENLLKAESIFKKEFYDYET